MTLFFLNSVCLETKALCFKERVCSKVKLLLNQSID